MKADPAPGFFLNMLFCCRLENYGVSPSQVLRILQGTCEGGPRRSNVRTGVLTERVPVAIIRVRARRIDLAVIFRPSKGCRTTDPGLPRVVPTRFRTDPVRP